MVEPEEMSEQNLEEAVEGLPEVYRESPHVGGDHLKIGTTHRSLENNPELHELHNRVFLTLWQENTTGLTPKETELVILSVARAFGPRSGVLMWNSHSKNAVMVGWEEEEIAAIANGEFEALGDRHSILARYSTAVAHNEATDQLHDELAEYYEHRTIVGILLLSSYYVLCNHVITAVGAASPDPVEGYEHIGYEALFG